MTHATHIQRARAYYDAIDGDDYDRLADLLTPSFVHDRPDRTIEGRDRFVRFMRDERPQTDTTHPLDGLYYRHEGDAAEADGDRLPTAEVAARGRLLDADGDPIMRFVDVFTVSEAGIERIETYAR